MGVLKGHGREFSSYTFVDFGKSTAAAVRKFLHSLPVKSALDQYNDASNFRAFGVRGLAFYSIALSATGYSKAGVAASHTPTDGAFLGGMKRASARYLSDPPVSEWDQFFQGSIDAVIITASSDKAFITESPAIWRDLVEQSEMPDAKFYTLHGFTLRNDNGQAVEQFGFADGISRPLFFRKDIDAYSGSIEGKIEYDPSFNPKDVLLAECYPFNGAFGSYLCIRKLEQNRVAFEASTREIAASIGATETWVASASIGRYRNGNPLGIAGPNENFPTESHLNNFDYSEDPAGLRCPLHSHVRKMNQREKNGNAAFQVIDRRGVLYAEETDGRQSLGLLFVAFQRDIGFQFETLQARWANDVIFPGKGRQVGCDPIIGNPRDRTRAQQRWPTHWGSENGVRHLMSDVIRCRGGEYFFAPPPEFFRSLV